MAVEANRKHPSIEHSQSRRALTQGRLIPHQKLAPYARGLRM
jgi:hypothetical protein